MESNDLPRFERIDRQQVVLEPLDVEQVIPEDHAARSIWSILGGLDLTRFLGDAKAVEGHAGRNGWSEWVSRIRPQILDGAANKFRASSSVPLQRA